MKDLKTEFSNLRRSFYISFSFISFLWLVWLLEWLLPFNLGFLGNYPRSIPGLLGIITSPLIHADYKHLFSNSLHLLILLIGTFYFYRQIAFKVVTIIYFLSGIGVWLMARESYHIGASGLLYGLASFLFFSGLFRKNLKLLIISVLTYFLYVGFLYGVFPTEPRVSWESHLFGAISGAICAFFFRFDGPEREPYSWEREDEDETEYDNWEYIYRKRDSGPSSSTDHDHHQRTDM